MDPQRDETPIRPDGNVASGDQHDRATGGLDSSPFEGLSSDERRAAAEEPQNAPADRPENRD